MDLQEAYNELGLNYYSDKFLSLVEIEKVYKKLARQYRPDMNINFPKRIQELSEQKFKKINEAISVIREYHEREKETIRQEELKRQEEQRRQEEFKRREELRKQKELKKQQRKEFLLKNKYKILVSTVLLIFFAGICGYNFGSREIVYENKDVEKFTYVFRVKQGSAEYKYSNGDVETFKYKNGVKEGPAKFTRYLRSRFDDKMELYHTDEYRYSNGKKERPVRRTYSDGEVEIYN